ncbi:MAG: hypothetical protein ACYC5Y_11880 [Symbiobacteriia bacterium]
MAIPAPKTVPALVVAAVTAAIYAAMGEETEYVIREIRPVEPGPAPLWQKAGLLEQMNRRAGLYDRRR